MDADGRLIGEAENDQAGQSLGGVGDLDGDGFGDFLIGAHNNDAAGDNAGAVYVMFGPFSGELDLSEADVQLTGESAGDKAGAINGANGAGDVDGDGHLDLLIGAHYDDTGATDAGAAYLVDGGSLEGGIYSLSIATAKLYGEAENDRAGVSTAVSSPRDPGLGDVDGDGLADLLIGAWYDDGGGADAGAAYLVYGPVSGTMPLTSGATTKFLGEAAGDEMSFHALSSGGDIDGDGLNDALLSSFNNDGASGATYLIYGGF